MEREDHRGLRPVDIAVARWGPNVTLATAVKAIATVVGTVAGSRGSRALFVYFFRGRLTVMSVGAILLIYGDSKSFATLLLPFPVKYPSF